MDQGKAILNLEKYKAKIAKEFFKIVKDENDSYKIIQYFGPLRGKQKMNDEKWFQGNIFIDDITVNDPVLDLNKYTSDTGYTVRKKTTEELFKENIEIYKSWIIKNNGLINEIANHKKILKSVGLEQLCLSSETFTSLVDTAFNKINEMVNGNYSILSILQQEVECVNKILLMIDALHINGARETFENDFRYFYAMIN